MPLQKRFYNVVNCNDTENQIRKTQNTIYITNKLPWLKKQHTKPKPKPKP